MPSAQTFVRIAECGIIGQNPRWKQFSALGINVPVVE